MILHWALLITSLILLVAQLAVEKKRSIHILFAIFSGSMAMVAAKQLTADSIGPYQHLLAMGACATCNGYWLVARALFRQHSAISILHISVAGCVALLIISFSSLRFVEVISVVPVGIFDSSYIVLGELLTLFSSTLLMLAFWEGCRGFRGDCREGRWQRGLFLTSFGGVLLGCTIIGKNFQVPGIDLAAWSAGVAAIEILVVTQVLIVWRYHRDTLVSWGLKTQFLADVRLPEVRSADYAFEVSQSNDQAVDLALVRAIEMALTEQKVFLQTNLKLADFAQQLNVPEYKISRAFRHLNARNFNHYINRLRIQYAAQLLADPSQRRWPVLTIGIESGFASPGPFTRAFKAEYGCTPQEYRLMALGREAVTQCAGA